MDLTKTIEELRREKENLERAIAFLEKLQAPNVAGPFPLSEGAGNQGRPKSVGKAQQE